MQMEFSEATVPKAIDVRRFGMVAEAFSDILKITNAQRGRQICRAQSLTAAHGCDSPVGRALEMWNVTLIPLPRVRFHVAIQAEADSSTARPIARFFDLSLSIAMLSMLGHPLRFSGNQIHEATKTADIAVEFSAFLQHRL